MGNSQPKKSMSVEPKEHHAIKLLFLGEEDSGKSTLVNSLLRRDYCGNHKTESTEVISVPELLGMEGEPLCEMREDTHFMLIDTPGITDYGGSVADDVSRNWKISDLKIIVLDSTKPRHDHLLNFVKKLKAANDNIVIIGNKMDQAKDLDDPEKDHRMARSLQDHVEELLNVKCLLPNEKDISSKGGIFFLSLHASQACVLREAQRSQALSKKEFFALAADTHEKVNRVLRFDFGEQTLHQEWSLQRKRNEVYALVRDPKRFQCRLQQTHFAEFLEVLDLLIGGRQAQSLLIERQLVNDLRFVQPKEGMVQELERLFLRYQAIDASGDHVIRTFWNLYSKFVSEALIKFETRMDIKIVTNAVTELRAYAIFCHEMAITLKDDKLEGQEKETAGQKVASITKQLCDVISKRGFQWTFEESAIIKHNHDPSIYERGQSPPIPTWTNISPFDWNVILVSISNNLGIENFHGEVREGLLGLEHVKQFGSFFPRDQKTLSRLVELSSGIESKNLAKLLSASDWDNLGKLLRDTLVRFLYTQDDPEAPVNGLSEAQSIDTIDDLESNGLSHQPMVPGPMSTSAPIARGDAVVPRSTTSPNKSVGLTRNVAAHPVSALNSPVTSESRAPSWQSSGYILDSGDGSSNASDSGTAESPIEVIDAGAERPTRAKKRLPTDDLHAKFFGRMRTSKDETTTIDAS
jgi:small GTP-binding protein